MQNAEDFDIGADEIAPPYVDVDGKKYKSLETLVNACMHYFYSRPRLDTGGCRRESAITNFKSTFGKEAHERDNGTEA